MARRYSNFNSSPRYSRYRGGRSVFVSPRLDDPIEEQADHISRIAGFQLRWQLATGLAQLIRMGLSCVIVAVLVVVAAVLPPILNPIWQWFGWVN